MTKGKDKASAYHEAGHAVVHTFFYGEAPRSVFICHEAEGHALTGIEGARGGTSTPGMLYGAIKAADSVERCVVLRDPSMRGAIAGEIAVLLAGEQGRQFGVEGRALPYFEPASYDEHGGAEDVEQAAAILRAWKPRSRHYPALCWLCGMNRWILERHASEFHLMADNLFELRRVDERNAIRLLRPCAGRDWTRRLSIWWTWAQRDKGRFDAMRFEKLAAKV